MNERDQPDFLQHQSPQAKGGLDAWEKHPLDQVFSQAKTSATPLEPTLSPEQHKQLIREKNWAASPKYTDPDHLKGSKLAEVPNANPEFNRTAQGESSPSQREGRNSNMVTSDQPKAVNKPPPELSENADRQSFKERWAKEQQDAKDQSKNIDMEELAKRVAQLEAYMAQGQNQQQTRGLGR